MNEDKLSSSIAYLPIDLIDRVQLWLTYKNIKPASTVMFPSPENDDLGKRRKRVEKWIEDAGLKYESDTQNPRLVHVSKEANNVKILKELQWSEKAHDITKRGLLYGYPEEAAKEFSKAWVEKNLGEKMASKSDVGLELGDSYWKPYLNYSVRKKHIKEDSVVAKVWADEMRSSAPKLAKWFEKNI